MLDFVYNIGIWKQDPLSGYTTKGYCRVGLPKYIYVGLFQ